MAEEQKPVEVAETTPVVAEPATETKPVEDKPVETAPVAEAATTEAPAEATETTEAAAPAEEAKEEVKPIEAGTLEHKGAPANFPKYVAINFTHDKDILANLIQEPHLLQAALLVRRRCHSQGQARYIPEE